MMGTLVVKGLIVNVYSYINRGRIQSSDVICLQEVQEKFFIDPQWLFVGNNLQFLYLSVA